MTKTLFSESAHTADPGRAVATDASPANSGLPNRLLTAFEVAEFVGCHEETVRRQRPAFSSAGRTRLDRPRSANSSLVNETKELNM